MHRYRLRLFATFLTFCIGLSAFKMISLLEDVIVDHIYTADEYRCHSPSPSGEIRALTVPTNLPDSNEIYNVILKLFKDPDVELLVVQSESEGYIISADESLPKDLSQEEAFSKTVQRFMSEADTETLDNYLAVNKVSGPLTISAPDLNVVLIPQPEFPDNLGMFWDTFYKTYPNSSGLIYFSHVGFNSSNDQAFVYVGRSCGGLCGSGSYILLKKRNGRWLILSDSVLWIS